MKRVVMILSVLILSVVVVYGATDTLQNWSKSITYTASPFRTLQVMDDFTTPGSVSESILSDYSAEDRNHWLYVYNATDGTTIINTPTSVLVTLQTRPETGLGWFNSTAFTCTEFPICGFETIYPSPHVRYELTSVTGGGNLKFDLYSIEVTK